MSKYSAHALTIAIIATTGCLDGELPDESAVAQNVGSGGSGGTFTPAPQICVVDQIKLAEHSKIDSGGIGSVGVDVGRGPTIHTMTPMGVIEMKGPFVYHPEKLLRFTCARAADQSCKAAVATSTMTYETGPQVQQGLAGQDLWVHPSINVARNSPPVVMATASGFQYSPVHFHAPATSRQFTYEPTYLKGRDALAAAVSTASAITERTWFEPHIEYMGFKVELPEIGWREAHHENGAGAIVSCGLSQPCTPDATVTVWNNSDKPLVVSNCTGTYTIEPNQTMSVNAKRNDSLRGAHSGSSVYGLMQDPANGKSYTCRYESTPYQGSYNQQRTVCQ